MQLRAGLRLLDVLADHIALEQRDLLAVVAGHHQHRHLAERRDLQETVRLVGEIDVDSLERHALLLQRDDSALHIGTELVADQLQGGHDEPRVQCNCIELNAAAWNCQGRCICI
jgi:predicted proteasome-type protease